MNQREAEEINRGNLLQKFWSRPKENQTAFQNAVDDNPLNVLRRAFQSLSVEEQKKVRQEQYGDEEPVEESDVFVDEKLQELDREIDILSDNAKKAYTEAIQQEIERTGHTPATTTGVVDTPDGSDQKRIGGDNDDKYQDLKEGQAAVTNGKEYVRSKSFRLMFLRAEKFNARLASRRITRYFKEKKELFGIEKLSSKIKHTDLSDVERELLYSGWLCSTGATDKHGRLILYYCPLPTYGVDVDCLRRAAFYFYQIIGTYYEVSQKKGLVVVGDARGMSLSQAWSEARLYALYRTIIHSIPFSNACWHPCYDSTTYHVHLKLALAVMPTKTRSMIQPHYGKTGQEMFESLSEYGFGVEDLPLTAEFEFRRELVENFLDDLREKEESSGEASVSETD